MKPPRASAKDEGNTSTRRPLSGFFALSFLAMAAVLLWSFFASSQSAFWYERCAILGIGAALVFLALFVWVRDLWAAHLVTLSTAVAVVGLVGAFHDTARESAVLPTIFGFVGGAFLWYFILIRRRPGR
jgi:hypothetical protein